MPIVPNRDAQQVKELLLAAFKDEVAAVLEQGQVENFFPVQVKGLLRQVNAGNDVGAAPVTSGFVQSHFGGKDGFVNEVMNLLVGPQAIEVNQIILKAADQLLSGADPKEVRRQAAIEDISSFALNDEVPARLWFLHVAYSRQAVAGHRVEATYGAFDAAFLPLYKLELEVRRRELRPGVELETLAATHTALVEGVALRLLGDRGLSSAVRQGLLQAATDLSEAAFEMLTREAADVSNPGPSTSSFRHFVRLALRNGGEDLPYKWQMAMMKRHSREVPIMGPVAAGLSASQHDEESDWQERAACNTEEPESFFPPKGQKAEDVTKVFKTCPVRTECLQYALDNNERFGVWGGLTESQRRKLSEESAPRTGVVRPRSLPA